MSSIICHKVGGCLLSSATRGVCVRVYVCVRVRACVCVYVRTYMFSKLIHRASPQGWPEVSDRGPLQFFLNRHTGLEVLEMFYILGTRERFFKASVAILLPRSFF